MIVGLTLHNHHRCIFLELAPFSVMEIEIFEESMV